MVLWFIYFILALITSVLCCLTNWLVVLFADDNGELPGPLKYWQTWDNSLDCSDSVLVAPRFLQYNWKEHYREYKGTDEYLWSVNRERWYSECTNTNFTVKELLQRYACRVLWLYRNNAYGWAFYMLGLNVSPKLSISQSEHTLLVKEVFDQGMYGAWMYKNTAPIFQVGKYILHWNNLLGWKIDTSATVDTRAMVAIRIAFYIETEAD